MTLHNSTPRTVTYALLALVPALLLVACGGAGDSAGDSAGASTSPVSQAASDNPAADSTQVNTAIRNNPCELAPPEMVAALFEVPVAELERTTSGSSACAYQWENDTRRLDVRVQVAGIDEDAARVTSNFRSATRGMSGADLDSAMTGIREQAAEDGGMDTAGKREAADAVVDSSGDSTGIRFEDVDGVGNEARLALSVGAGELHVRAGNLYFVASAYLGPEMQMATGMSAGSILAADRQWRRETMPQRRQAAIKLAQAVVQDL